MSSISGLSSYNALSYTSQLLSKLNSSSTEDSQQTNPFEQTSTQESGSSLTSETKRHRQVSSLDDSTLQALLQGMETSSTSATESVSAQDMVTAMDTDGDGTITQEEFVSARPDDVSEDMANSLWSQFDTESAGSLSTDEMQTAMASGRPHGPPPPPPEDDDDDDDTTVSSTDDSESLQSILSQLLDEAAGTSTTSDSGTFDDMIAAMDTDNDGTVTQDEFVAARPEDVSEDMATNLWNSFDTEGVGSLSTSALKTAMAESAPPPPPDGTQMASNSTSSAYQSLLDQLTSGEDSTSTTSTSSTSTTTQGKALQAFLEAVQAYESTAGYSATKEVLSSLMALA